MIVLKWIWDAIKNYKVSAPITVLLGLVIIGWFANRGYNYWTDVIRNINNKLDTNIYFSKEREVFAQQRQKQREDSLRKDWEDKFYKRTSGVIDSNLYPAIKK